MAFTPEIFQKFAVALAQLGITLQDFPVSSLNGFIGDKTSYHVTLNFEQVKKCQEFSILTLRYFRPVSSGTENKIETVAILRFALDKEKGNIQHVGLHELVPDPSINRLWPVAFRNLNLEQVIARAAEANAALLAGNIPDFLLCEFKRLAQRKPMPKGLKEFCR